MMGYGRDCLGLSGRDRDCLGLSGPGRNCLGLSGHGRDCLGLSRRGRCHQEEISLSGLGARRQEDVSLCGSARRRQDNTFLCPSGIQYCCRSMGVCMFTAATLVQFVAGGVSLSTPALARYLLTTFNGTTTIQAGE